MWYLTFHSNFLIWKSYRSPKILSIDSIVWDFWNSSILRISIVIKLIIFVSESQVNCPWPYMARLKNQYRWFNKEWINKDDFFVNESQINWVYSDMTSHGQINSKLYIRNICKGQISICKGQVFFVYWIPVNRGFYEVTVICSFFTASTSQSAIFNRNC